MTQLFPILIEDPILVPALLFAIFYRSFAKNHHTCYLRMSLSSPPIRRQYKIRLRKLVFPEGNRILAQLTATGGCRPPC